MARLLGICPREGMVRSGYDPHGLNQLVVVDTVGARHTDSESLGVSELHAAVRWRQRISPSRRP
jgi:hypothetical protein